MSGRIIDINGSLLPYNPHCVPSPCIEHIQLCQWSMWFCPHHGDWPLPPLLQFRHQIILCSS